MKTPLRLFVGAITLAGFPATAGAAGSSWHVRPDGSDVNCGGYTDAADPGTGTTPRACSFETPQAGVDAAGAGDTVVLHAGTYATAGKSILGVEDIIGLDGRSEFDSEKNRLTVRSAGDGEVIFDGGGVIDTGVTIWGTSYVTLEGIQFRRFTAARNLPRVGSLAALWASFAASGVNVDSPGPELPSSHLILRSLDIGESMTAESYLHSAEIALWCRNCTHNTIAFCRISNVAGQAIAVGGFGADQFGLIANNTIVRAPAVGGVGIFSEDAGFWTVQGNFFEGNSDPSTGTGISVGGSSHWAITGNVFHHPSYAAISLLTSLLDDASSHSILNNTIDCDGAGIGVQSRCRGCLVQNNIIRRCATAVQLRSDNSGTQLGFNDLFDNVADYDSTAGAGFGFELVGGDIADPPLFRKALPRPDPYYRLAPTSAAIDAGNDVRCGVVPIDGACDMGAFQITVPKVIAASPPSGDVEVRIGVEPQLIFNIPLEANSITPSAIKLLRKSPPQSELPSSLFLDEPGTTVTVTPLDLVDADSSYEIMVRGGGVRSRDGSDSGRRFSSTFTTETALAASYPASDATEIPTSVAPQLVFKWVVYEENVNPIVFKLRDLTSGKNIALASVVLQGDGLTVTMTPAVSLKPNHKYRVRVAAGPLGLRYATEPRAGRMSQASSTNIVNGHQLGRAIKVTFRTGLS